MPKPLIGLKKTDFSKFFFQDRITGKDTLRLVKNLAYL